MSSTPKTTKAREEGLKQGKPAVKDTEPAAAHRNGIPILYASWQHRPGAISHSDWTDHIHRALRIKHSKVADQIKTGERRHIEPPIMPREPVTPESGADQETVEMYKIKVQIYLSQMVVYTKAHAAHDLRMEEETNNEKALASEILTCISGPLYQKLQQDIHEIDLCSDIPRIMTAIKKYYAETNAKSARRILLHALLAHARIKMIPGDSLYDYYRKYLESMRKAEEGGAQPLDDDLEAIKFIESLPTDTYGEWQMSLVNREHDAQASGQEESPWPKTVLEAYTIASARLSPYGKIKNYDVDMQGASTINKAVGRPADSEGRGGGTRKAPASHEDDDSPPSKPYKTHAAKAERAIEEECYVCDGAFNYMTRDKKHSFKYCPLVTISSKDKKTLMAKLLQRDGDEDESTEVAKTSTAHKITKRQSYARYSDSEDEEEFPYAVIQGTASK